MNDGIEQRVKAMEGELYGFSLKSVCWGYRKQFAQIIDGLLSEEKLSSDRQQSGRYFFEFLKQADQGAFDHVLKEFISSINPKTRWILDLPLIFSEIITVGREIAEVKLNLGITYFKKWGEGAFGDTPKEVRQQLQRMRRMKQVDAELAIAFLHGYSLLRERLRSEEVELYIQHGLQLFKSNSSAAKDFMRGESARSENIIRSITKECRLEDVSKEMSVLLRSLLGYEIEVNQLGQLDSDALWERGATLVCMYKWLYLPKSVRRFESQRRNRQWYILTAVVAAGMLSENSFPRIHGVSGYKTCADLVGGCLARVNLLQIIEYVRILNKIRTRWPGIRGVLDMALADEFGNRSTMSSVEILLKDCLILSLSENTQAKIIMELAGKSHNIFDTVALIDDETVELIKRDYPEIGRAEYCRLSFLPDFLFPGEISQPSVDFIADLRETASRLPDSSLQKGRDSSLIPNSGESGNQEQTEQSETEVDGVKTCFIYDEWRHNENSYHKDYCQLYEQCPVTRAQASTPGDIGEEARRVRRIFERLKPELAQKQKGLQEGDEINHDRLIEFWMDKKRDAAPRVDFYEKPLTSYRDLAVLVLLDASGSTGEGTNHSPRIIEMEKRAAFIFGEGLAALGDSFAVCGFNTNGRKKCQYYLYKDFDQDWDQDSRARLSDARPVDSTRMGPALRHSGEKLALLPNRQRLIIFITDGKPMDEQYDHHSGYAQYDVRKACEENFRRDISTFAISTEENSYSDMELMFSRRSFMIIPGLRKLPELLPRLYLKLTA